MEYFFKTTESIPDGVGFAHFDVLHISWLIFFVIVVIFNVILYKKLADTGRKRWRIIVSILLLADEVFKVAVLAGTGQYEASYLPLHLCSINIFVIAWYTYRPSKTLASFLYTVCIPGTMAALLFPSWAVLPLGNAMHLHSFTVHILLALYPIVLTVNGELKPHLSGVPKSLGLLLMMAIPIYGLNLLLDTNFMFLMEAEAGNPLYWFGQNWGNHLWGFPVIIAGVLLIMYGPLELYYWISAKRSKSA